MRYDPESNIISLEIAAGKIDRVVELGNFLIHVNKNKKPLLVEILDGGRLIGQFSANKKKLMELTIAADS